MLTILLFFLASQLLRVSCGPVNTTLRIALELPPGSLAAPLANPASVYNPNNLTCDGLNKLNASAQWQAVDGDSIMHNLVNFFVQNSMICKECFGQDKDQCKSQSSTDCQRGGLKDQATVNGIARFDKAAAIFSGNQHQSGFQCSLPAKGCNVPLDCRGYINGPGIYLIMTSLATLSNTLQNEIGQIETANRNLQVPMLSASDPFANTFASKWKHEVDRTTFADWLNATTLDFKQTYINASNALFIDGTDYVYSGNGNLEASMQLADLMKAGGLVKPDPAPNDVPNLSRILLQQLALSTWAYVATDNLRHVPYITFDAVSCNEVKSRAAGSLAKNALFRDLDMDNGITMEGKCYYFLDGTPGRRHSSTCVGTSTPTGATNSTLEKEAVALAGLDVADWVIPAVKGFLANNNNNNYSTAMQDGLLLSDPQTAAAVWIPVCDFVENPNAPGKGCPQLGKQVVTNNKVKSCPLY